MKKCFMELLKVLLLFLTLIVIFILIAVAIHKCDERKYNNGVCTKCEKGHYVFTAATDRKVYYYTCDECGHTIATDSIMK